MLVKYGKQGVFIQREVFVALKNLPQDVRDLLWDTCSQGKGMAKASGITHKYGWCVDFSFKRSKKWTNRMLHRVCMELIQEGFAVGPRAHGELSPTNPAHLHIAYRGKANWAAILTAQKKGATLDERINRAIPQRELALELDRQVEDEVETLV